MPNKLSRFWQELKRRRVIHVIIVYATAAVVIIGLVSDVYESLQLPDWTPALTLIILAIGFPLAIIFSWIYNISRKGIVKTEAIDSIEQKREARSTSVKTTIQENSIIVLPFENMSSDPEQEYFSDGITEEIITDLSHIHDLMVISRSSAMTFKGAKKKTKEIASEVNVRYVLEGSVRKAGNNLRITAQLIDSETDAHIWADKYNGALNDVFDIQEKVSQSIAEALNIELNSKEKRELLKRPISDVQGYECFLRAKNDIYTYTKEGLEKGVKTLQIGLDQYGDNALLYATLGEVHILFFDIGYVTDEAILGKAEEYARKTLALDPESAYGYKLLALLERGHGSLKKACKYIKKAYDGEPNESSILMYAASFLGMYAGNPSFSKSLFSKLLEIDPLSPLNNLMFGMYHYTEGNFSEALELVSKFNQMIPELMWSKFWLANIYAAKNDINKAITTIDETLHIEGIDQIIKELLLFFKYVLLGDKEKALKALGKEAKTYTWNDPDFSYFMSGYYALLHEKEEAFRWIEHSIDRDFLNFPFLNSTYPFLENIRGEARFKKLMKKVKHEWETFEV